MTDIKPVIAHKSLAETADELTPIDHLYDENDQLRAEIGRCKAATTAERERADHAVARAVNAENENERLRERVVMLMVCHYAEHKHSGSPTCFDVQSPDDEWEDAALAEALDRAKRA